MKHGHLLLALVLALAAGLLVAAPAQAHANLVRSNPALGATIASAPPTVELEFSESLDPSFSRAQLFDDQNKLIEKGPGEVSSANAKLLQLTIPDLSQGSYTVIWRVRSAADGHVTEGSLPFGVGVAPRAGSLIPAPGTPDPATLPPPPLDTAARWLNFLAAIVALGGIPFALLVWRPVWRRAVAASQAPGSGTGDAPADSPLSAADAAMTSFLRRMALIGGVAFLLTNLFFLVTQAATAADVSIAQAIGAPMVALLNGRAGILWLSRFALIVQIIVLAWRLPPAGSGSTRLWWSVFVVGAVSLLTMSMLSHAAADPQAAVAIPLDWLHLAAMAAWIGGLLPLAAAIRAAWRSPERAVPLKLLIPGFTRLALPCVVALTLTGLYAYWLHIGTLDLLAATTYGRALLIKVALFVVLVSLGALNTLIFSRWLRSIGERRTALITRSVRVEVFIGVLILLLAGALTSVAPSLAAWEAHEQQGIAQSATVGDVALTLRIAPAQIGDNEFAVDVSDRRPGAAAAASKVLLRFDMQGMNMSKIQAETTPSGDERYSAHGSYTSMGGRWDVEVVLRRAGFDDVTHIFQVDILRGAPFEIQ